MSNPLLLDADSEAELRNLITETKRDHPGAALLSAERIPARGFGKWAKPERFRATMQIPAVLPAPEFDTASRLGIAALLDASDAAEDSIAGRQPSVADDFDEMMSKLDSLTRPAPEVDGPQSSEAKLVAEEPTIVQWAEKMHAQMTPPPVPRDVPGDLIAVVGLTADATAVAQQMAKHFGGETRAAGSSKMRGKQNLTDRRSTLDARAEAVERQKVIFCAFGFEGTGADIGVSVAGLHPDQVWAVVDAGRKPEDTERWVKHLQDTAGVTAIAAVGVNTTSSPQTLNSLGFPVGWSDGAPTTSQRL